MISVTDLISQIKIDANSIGRRIENSEVMKFATRVVRELRSGRIIPESKKILSKEIYSDIFQYSLPADFDAFVKPNEPLRGSLDEGPYHLYSRAREFKSNNNVGFAIDHEDGTKFLLARVNGLASLAIDNFDSSDLTVYTVGGDGADKVQDKVLFREGSSALRFEITDSSNETTIERTLDSPVDISDYLKVGRTFLWVYMSAVFTSVSIRLLSSAGNYYEITGITSNFNGTSFKVGYNLLSFDMADATETGSPDEENIASYKITIDNTGVSGLCRLDGFSLKLGREFEIPYYSKNVIQVSSNDTTLQEEIDNTNNQILFDNTFTEYISWLVLEQVAVLKYQDIELTNFCIKEQQKWQANFSRRYPSDEALKQTQRYRRARNF